MSSNFGEKGRVTGKIFGHPQASERGPQVPQREQVPSITREKLANIAVLYREKINLTLWGIPYEMREGQQPSDLKRAYDNYVPPKPGHYGSSNIDLSDWICLGYPGSTHTRLVEEAEVLREFMTMWKAVGAIPEGHDEWTRLADFETLTLKT